MAEPLPTFRLTAVPPATEELANDHNWETLVAVAASNAAF
jgi:hypothetical protein